jgi:hypothetical protein
MKTFAALRAFATDDTDEHRYSVSKLITME